MKLKKDSFACNFRSISTLLPNTGKTTVRNNFVSAMKKFAFAVIKHYNHIPTKEKVEIVAFDQKFQEAIGDIIMKERF